MTSTIVRSTISVPTTTPLVGTLLDAVSVTALGPFADPEGMYLSYNCLDFSAETQFPCPDPGDAKDFGDYSTVSGFRFAAYGGLVCKAIGFGTEDVPEDQMRRVFEANESVGVEKAFMATRFRVSAPGDPEEGDLWDAPVDITPAGGAVDPYVGIALLEGHAASRYAGAPIIHMPRTIGALAWAKADLEQRGDTFFTPQGSKVASGGGYEALNTSPAGVAAPAGERWMYATGEIALQRGEIVVKREMDTTTNEVFVLAERLYVASVDCYTAAVRVKVI